MKRRAMVVYFNQGPYGPAPDSAPRVHHTHQIGHHAGGLCPACHPNFYAEHGANHRSDRP